MMKKKGVRIKVMKLKMLSETEFNNAKKESNRKLEYFRTSLSKSYHLDLKMKENAYS